MQYSKKLAILVGLVLYVNVIICNTTIMITGAAGFIGSNFLKYMFNKYPEYQFVVLDSLTYAGNLDNIPEYIRKSERFNFFYGSITNTNLVDALMQGVDMVVHFAAESHVTNSIYEDKTFFSTDVNGTRVMMRNLIKHRTKVKRFIHISTSEVYGTAESIPMSEDHPLNPRSPYAAAKTGADRLVYAYWCTYDIPALILRPFNNYGPNQHIEKLIPRLITNALTGKKLKIDGAGSQLRDWVHVEDTCDAIDKALHLAKFELIKNKVINVGTGRGISVLEIAQKIANIMNLSSDKIEFVADRPGQVECHLSSTDRAKSLLNWQASKNFDLELIDIIKWYKENHTWWNKTILLTEYLSKNAFNTKSIISL